MKKIVGLVLLAVLGFAPKVFADVSFYGQCNYQGPEVKLSAGQYTAADLARQGIPEDAINSIKVPDGFEVTLYENDRFGGRYGTLRSSDACLEDDNFDKLVSSLTIVETASSFGNKPAVVISEDTTHDSSLNSRRRAITVFSECDYQGRSATFAVGEFNNAQLNKAGIANNSISSIRIGDGFQAELYINDFHRGRSGTLTRNTRCLGAEYNNEVSSIAVQKTADVIAAAPMPVVSLFTHCNYRGGSVDLPVGQYNAAALKAARVQDNSVSSIKVAEGYTVTIYAGSSFNDKELVLTADDDCLDNDYLNEQLSSLVVESLAQRANQATVIAKPSQSTSAKSNVAQLQAGLNCVKQYVEQEACDAQRMVSIEKRCQLATIPLLSDGYLKGHIEAGNCTAELWDELVQRTSNPALR